MRTVLSAPAETTQVGERNATARTPPSCAPLMAPIFLPSEIFHTARLPSCAPATTTDPLASIAKEFTAAEHDPNRNTMLPVLLPLVGIVLNSRLGEPVCVKTKAPSCRGMNSNWRQLLLTGLRSPPSASVCSWNRSMPLPSRPPTRIERKMPRLSTAQAWLWSFGSGLAQSSRCSATTVIGFSATTPPRRPFSRAASSMREISSSFGGSLTNHV
mmetsp:Transcript_2348/g.10722  ORF Transcript_2348/g.10722 Transcript_2348/m.10722 type:complete len:214 (+) Transcript_2348:7771-8412(+)